MTSVGKKPLYYWQGPGGVLVFGNEIKAVLAHPAVPRELDPRAIPAYLTFGYVPTPYTLFAGVCSLPPGHVLVQERGGGAAAARVLVGAAARSRRRRDARPARSRRDTILLTVLRSTEEAGLYSAPYRLFLGTTSPIAPGRRDELPRAAGGIRAALPGDGRAARRPGARDRLRRPVLRDGHDPATGGPVDTPAVTRNRR
jgi:hypothetical protein